MSDIMTLAYFRRAVSTTGLTYEDKPFFELSFIKGQYTIGFGGINPSTGIMDISYQDLIVDIVALPRLA